MNEYRSTEINELITALSQAQGEVQNAHCSGGNSHFGNRYAKVHDLIAVAQPILLKHKLAIVPMVETEPDGTYYYVITLSHASGQFMVSRTKMNGLEDKQKSPIQAFGSTRTYLYRYTVKEILGISTPEEDDDDGNSLINATQVEELFDLLAGDENLKKELLKSGKLDKISNMLAVKFNGAIKWIEAQKKK